MVVPHSCAVVCNLNFLYLIQLIESTVLSLGFVVRNLHRVIQFKHLPIIIMQCAIECNLEVTLIDDPDLLIV